MTHHRLQEAEEILRHIAKKNGKELAGDFKLTPIRHQSNVRNYLNFKDKSYFIHEIKKLRKGSRSPRLS
jgi:hypothetical protein